MGRTHDHANGHDNWHDHEHGHGGGPAVLDRRTLLRGSALAAGTRTSSSRGCGSSTVRLSK